MSEGAVRTLFLPFENGVLPRPIEGEQFLFLNAAPPPAADHDWHNSLHCIQGFRTDFLALQNAGYLVRPQPDRGMFPGALVLLGKHRELNRINIYAALERTLPGGPILICGAKSLGVQSMRKELAGLLPVEQVLSKNHAQVFWCLRPESWVSPPVAPREMLRVGELMFETAPGMFSHGAADAGSELLARHFGDVGGKAADFGAGWGYLSAMLLRNARKVVSLDLFEADFASLQAARRNIAACGACAPSAFHWRDLLAEPAGEFFDTIIMNPPFHTGRGAEVSLGQRMIAAAAKALKPGGRLLMVANRELPYESGLQRDFRRFERIDEDSCYKVINAVK